jgi:hypothetical protein
MSTTSWVVFGNPFAFPFTFIHTHQAPLLHSHPHPPTQLLFHIFHSFFEQQNFNREKYKRDTQNKAKKKQQTNQGSK